MRVIRAGVSKSDDTDWSDVEPHIWLGSYTPGDIAETPFMENALRFVERYDLTVVLSQWSTTEKDARELEARLEEAQRRDVDVWLGTYDLREHSDRELVTDPDALASDVERLERMVDTYAEHYPEGNVFVWHESPLTGQWTGETRDEQAHSIQENGAEIFGAQKTAIEERHPGVDLGLMIHYPYVAPPSHSEKPIFGPLMADLAERDARPDFTYFDFYRGYHEWDGGYEATNDFLDAIVENLREHTDDRPVCYLGECHSINNHYTPSKQSILGNLRTALAAGVDSYGWYIRKGFRESVDRNYNPFLPNVGDEPAPFNSLVGSRDRLLWSHLALNETVRGTDASARFDLWLHGHDFDFYEYDLSLETSEGEREFIGSFSGYVDGDTPYSGGGRDRTVVFHALERDRYLADDEFSVCIEPRDGADGAVLETVYAVPHLDSRQYMTEPELSEVVSERSLEEYALATNRLSIELGTAGRTTASVAVSDPTAPIEELVRPEQRDAYADLVDLEATSGFSPRDRFDLWVYGSDLDAISLELDGESIAAHRSDDPGSAAVAYRGLDRIAHLQSHTGGHALDIRATGSPATVEAMFVMPYHGTRNFKTDADVAYIIDRDYSGGTGQLTTFSLGHQMWPDGADLGAMGGLDIQLQVPRRRIVAGRAVPEY